MWNRKKVRFVDPDSWPTSGNRLGMPKSINMETGEKIATRCVIDFDEYVFKVECRRCGNWGIYKLLEMTEDQQGSGLCPTCYSKENPNVNFYAIDPNGELVQGNTKTGMVEPVSLKESEIENIEKFKVWTGLELVRSPRNPLNVARKVSLEGGESKYAQEIHNREITAYIRRIRSFEKWRRENPHEWLYLMGLRSQWAADAETFRQKFPNAKSPWGRQISTYFLRAMIRYSHHDAARVMEEWQKFEFAVRDCVMRWYALDPRRLIIFHLEGNKFCYKEIDTLAKCRSEYVLIDAKWSGGVVDLRKLDFYVKALSKCGIRVGMTIAVTAGDVYENVTENTCVMPHDMFRSCESVCKVLKFIRITKMGARGLRPGYTSQL